jgi:hypothetical protein
MAAQRGRGLEQHHLVPARQQVGAGQPGNAGADDGDALLAALRWLLRLDS